MRTCRTLLFATLGILLLCSPAFAGGSSVVYVSGGVSGNVYTAGVSTPLLTESGHQLEGMVFGPDQMIYVCEPQNGVIIRFDPTSPVAHTVFAYPFSNSDKGPQEPQCGRFTSTGDLLVSDVAGSGVWEFPGMSGSASPTSITPQNVLTGAQLRSESFRGAGLTQLNNGDLVIVNQAENSLYLAPYSSSGLHFSTASLITLSSGSLDTPIGVARNSTNDLFVSNGGETDNILRLHLVSGTTYAPTTCATFPVVEGPKYRPNFLQFSADDTLYVATQTTGDIFSNPGAVFSVTLTGGGCNAPTPVATLPRYDSDPVGGHGDDPEGLNSDDAYAQAIGIALPPTATATVTKPISTPAGRNFNFNFTSYQISNTPASCSATVSAIQSPAFVTTPGSLEAALASLKSNLQVPSNSVLVPYLGEGGSGTVYHVDPELSTCTSGNILLGAFTPNLTNPRIIHCHSGIGSGCDVIQPNAVYPLSGPIPGDGGVGGGVPNFSDFFVIDEGLSTTPGVAGTFCGFQFPLNTTQDPSKARKFDEDDFILVSFRVAAAGGSCTSGPFVDNAKVVVSLSEIDPSFAAIRNPENLVTSNINGALFFHTYFGLISLEDLPVGTYDLSLFFPNGTSAVVDTVFKIVPEGTPGSF